MTGNREHYNADTSGGNFRKPSGSDPVFPTGSEYEIDSNGPKGSHSKHPGLLWALIAIIAVIILCIAFVMSGDWMSPQEAQTVQDAQENAQIAPEDN